MSDTFSVDVFADLFDEYSGPIPSRVQVASPVHIEKCIDCNGTGTFRGWSGRVVGQCFKCKGKGTREFKLSAAQRQAGRDYAQKRKQQQSAKVVDKVEAWKEANPAETAWLQANTGRWEFATSLNTALIKYGALTDGQLGAVRKCLQRDVERTQNRAAEAAARVAAAPQVSVAAIETAFETAMSKGIKRPKMRLAGFKFSLAAAHSANAGAIYVKQGEVYLGKIANGKLIKSRDCSDDAEQEIVTVCSDPKNAAIAYGRRTGSCAICARELTNKQSIELGIGPICAEKYGW